MRVDQLLDSLGIMSYPSNKDDFIILINNELGAGRIFSEIEKIRIDKDHKVIIITAK